MKKRMILVTSPPASGKTFVSKQLAKNIPNIVYLDKDALIPLSSHIFKVVGEENNRSSAFFEEHIRIIITATGTITIFVSTGETLSRYTSILRT